MTVRGGVSETPMVDPFRRPPSHAAGCTANPCFRSGVEIISGAWLHVHLRYCVHKRKRLSASLCAALARLREADREQGLP